MAEAKMGHLMKNTVLDQKFWSRFAKSYWEKKPLAIKQVKTSLTGIDEAAVFTMLVDYSDQCRRAKSVAGIKLYVDGERLFEESTLELLPAKKDKSLVGYHKRMEQLFTDYCLVCDELLQVEHESWDLLTQFLRGLFRQTGLPNRFAEVGLYLGNYRKTPFGVHVDGCGVFSFPIVGTKRFRLWTPEFVKKNPKLERASRYGEFKAASQLLEAGPGDMTYWPSKAWHIAESDGSFSATWSVGVWVDRPTQDVLIENIAPLMKRKLGAFGAQHTVHEIAEPEIDGQVRAMPREMAQSVSLLKSISKKELRDLLQSSWLIHASKQGLKNFPQVSRKSKLNVNSSVQSRLGQPLILWSRTREAGKFRFAYGGEITEVAVSQGFLKLVKDINLKKPCKLSNYLARSRSPKEFKALQMLYQSGAFSVTEL